MGSKITGKKYRVEKRGDGSYYPQYKRLWFWCDFIAGSWDCSRSYGTYKRAEEFLNDEVKRVERKRRKPDRYSYPPISEELK